MPLEAKWEKKYCNLAETKGIPLAKKDRHVLIYSKAELLKTSMKRER